MNKILHWLRARHKSRPVTPYSPIESLGYIKEHPAAREALQREFAVQHGFAIYLLAQEDMKRGAWVDVQDGNLLLYRAWMGTEWIPPRGVVTRDIHKGETVKYHPRENTEDILVRANLSIHG